MATPLSGDVGILRGFKSLFSSDKDNNNPMLCRVDCLDLMDKFFGFGFRAGICYKVFDIWLTFTLKERNDVTLWSWTFTFYPCCLGT